MHSAESDALHDPRLDFAYRYPFSDDARSMVSELSAGLEEKFLREGGARLEEAILNKRIRFAKTKLSYVKYAYLMSYIYAKMLVSALNNRPLISLYATAEARRTAASLANETLDDFIKVSNSLGSGLRYVENSFVIEFEAFLKSAPRTRDFSLVRQRLDKGIIYLNQASAAKFLTKTIRSEVAKNLPIPLKNLPRPVIEYAKKIKLPLEAIAPNAPDASQGKRYLWIEKLLATPIQDVRHRAVNLILAPYLVNIRNMSEEEATNLIINYIERCKEIDPSTRINATYIRYQCRYAKNKGMRPLSLVRAKELLSNMLNLDEYPV